MKIYRLRGSFSTSPGLKRASSNNEASRTSSKKVRSHISEDCVKSNCASLLHMSNE